MKKEKEVVQEVELKEEVWNSRVVAESRSRGLKRGLGKVRMAGTKNMNRWWSFPRDWELVRKDPPFLGPTFWTDHSPVGVLRCLNH